MVVASVPQTVASQCGPGAAGIGLCAEQREDRGAEKELWTVHPWGILEGGGHGREVPGRRKSLAWRHWCSYLTPRGDFLINLWLQSAQIIQFDEFPESLRIRTNLEKWVSWL